MNRSFKSITIISLIFASLFFSISAFAQENMQNSLSNKLTDYEKTINIDNQKLQNKVVVDIDFEKYIISKNSNFITNIDYFEKNEKYYIDNVNLQDFELYSYNENYPGLMDKYSIIEIDNRQILKIPEITYHF